MYIVLEIKDSEIYSTNANLPDLLDKAFKKQRQSKINELAKERKVFFAFNAWYLTAPTEAREVIMKNIYSTIPTEEIVNEKVMDRELVIEAINRIRQSHESENSDSK